MARKGSSVASEMRAKTSKSQRESWDLKRASVRSNNLLPLGTKVKLAAASIGSDGARYSGFDASTSGKVVLGNWPKSDVVLAVLVDGHTSPNHWIPSMWEAE